MFEVKKNNGSETSYARARVNLYLQSNTDSSLDEIGYVPVQGYAISSNGDELITDGLNACTALAFEAQGKVFLAHFTMNMESRIPVVLQSIKREFDAAALQNSDIKLKVLLGAWKGQTDSLDSILLLLNQLKLLERFVKQVQQHIRKHINEIADNTSMKRNELYQFLAIERVKNKNDVKRIAEFINTIKNEFTDLPDVVLEKQNAIDKCASTHKLATLAVEQLDCKFNQVDCAINLNDAIIDVNIIIERYYEHLLRGLRTKLFGSDPKQVAVVRGLQAKIENIRATSKSNEDLHAQLKDALAPYMAENNPKGEARLRSALCNVYAELFEQKHLGKRGLTN
ncbi:MAG: hypothetical protein A3J38_03810 [Gammaproteobacteria bacterium RIFCSPHIGHO2_12_FULL_45_9]|nr:MAG: hypothetical protein A3J38_03810 [Gammaproteobacteria bacterium RIFCSPHIGHO2_12_FULL_45_9]